MTVVRKLVICGLACGWALVTAAPTLAYTIVFKDESTLVTLQKYTIEGDQAVVILPSGTKISFPAQEIDTEKTEELNRLGVSRGIILDGRPPPGSTTGTRNTMADLVKGGYGALQLPTEPIAAVSKTRAGNLDLFTLRRTEPPRPEIAAAVKEALAQKGQRDSDLFAGTRESHLLVETVTDNEVEVFAVLSASAAALLAARIEQPDLEALELLMANSDRIRAAQFLLTPQGARQLVDGEVSPADFFLLNVQF